MFYNSHGDEHAAREHAKVILMNAIFVASYALYEHHREQVKDILSVARMDDPRISALLSTPDWEENKAYKTIRDTIMHQDGKIPARKNAFAYAERKGIRNDHLSHGRYVVTRQFCEESINNCQRFLLNAITELENADKSGDTR